MKQIIKKIIISPDSRSDELTRQILEFYPEAEKIFLDNNDPPDSPGDPKTIIFLTRGKGEVIKACPGTAGQYLCCRYQVINHTLNCPLDCTYCILQYYLNQPATVIHTNTDEIITLLKAKLDRQSDRFIRVGTGELGDSMALAGSRIFAKQVVKMMADVPNALFEIKSKVTQVDEFLDLNHQGRTVFSWSLNPPEIVKTEEKRATSIMSRLKAAQRVQQAGYLVGFHFDPILVSKENQPLYVKLVQMLYEYVDPAGIAWISMGSLRFPPSMKSAIAENYPDTSILYGEMITGMDGKLRYARPLRVGMYRAIYKALTSVENPPFIYFCMESPLVWQEVMGFAPESNAHLDRMFAESLQRRFAHLNKISIDSPFYESGLNLDGTKFTENNFS